MLRSWGRDVDRRALTNHRRLSIDHGQVRFRDQDAPRQRGKLLALPAQECSRRFLQPVLPPGFHQVRDAGLWRPVNRALWPRVQLGLAGRAPTPSPAAPAPATWPDDSGSLPLRAGQTWPHGGPGSLVLIRTIPRRQRGPPMRAPASARPAPFIITATQPAGWSSQALVPPSLEHRPGTIAAVPPRWLRFRPSTLPFRPLPPAQEGQPSADLPTKTLLKRGQRD
jgi:Putative transposase